MGPWAPCALVPLRVHVMSCHASDIYLVFGLFMGPLFGLLVLGLVLDAWCIAARLLNIMWKRCRHHMCAKGKGLRRRVAVCGLYALRAQAGV